MLADKPVAEIIAILDGVIDHWYLATLAGERGQTAQALKDQLAVAGCVSPAVTCDSPVAACLSAMADAGARDRVVIFGSFYTVGDILAHFEHDRGLGGSSVSLANQPDQPIRPIDLTPIDLTNVSGQFC